MPVVPPPSNGTTCWEWRIPQAAAAPSSDCRSRPRQTVVSWRRKHDVFRGWDADTDSRQLTAQARRLLWVGCIVSMWSPGSVPLLPFLASPRCSINRILTIRLVFPYIFHYKFCKCFLSIVFLTSVSNFANIVYVVYNHDSASLVYITCKICNRGYVGRTIRMRMAWTRYIEHLGDTRKGRRGTDLSDHMLAMHPNHQAKNDDFEIKIWETFKDEASLRITESIEIRNRRPALNKTCHHSACFTLYHTHHRTTCNTEGDVSCSARNVCDVYEMLCFCHARRDFVLIYDWCDLHIWPAWPYVIKKHSYFSCFMVICIYLYLVTTV